MRNRLSIYYGRILYVEPFPYQETFLSREPILEALEAAPSVERYRHIWMVGNLTVDEGAGVATGRLGYPRHERVTRENVDAQTHEFVEEEYELPDAVSAPFVFDYRSGAIAFDGDRIGARAFVNHLVALLNSANKGVFVGELIRVADDYRQFIKVVDKVTVVAFDVHPTNPRDRLIFRPLEQGMLAANARRQRVLMENRRDGLRVSPPDSRDEPTDNPAVMGIEMNEEGYGDGYRIEGERDGRPLRFDSKSGGLLRDVFEDAPPSMGERIRLLREWFDQRAELLEPGRSSAQRVEEPDDVQDEEVIETEDENEGWTEDV
jgi:hypothetical protein